MVVMFVTIIIILILVVIFSNDLYIQSMFIVGILLILIFLTAVAVTFYKGDLYADSNFYSAGHKEIDLFDAEKFIDNYMAQKALGYNKEDQAGVIDYRGSEILIRITIIYEGEILHSVMAFDVDGTNEFFLDDFRRRFSSEFGLSSELSN